MIETPDVSAMPTWLNRDEFEQLITRLSLVDRELYLLLAPNAPERISQWTKSEIVDTIYGAQYGGERVRPSWPKDALVEAYIALHRERLKSEKEALERRLCELLWWDYEDLQR